MQRGWGRVTLHTWPLEELDLVGYLEDMNEGLYITKRQV